MASGGWPDTTDWLASSPPVSSSLTQISWTGRRRAEPLGTPESTGEVRLYFIMVFSLLPRVLRFKSRSKVKVPIILERHLMALRSDDVRFLLSFGWYWTTRNFFHHPLQVKLSRTSRSMKVVYKYWYIIQIKSSREFLRLISWSVLSWELDDHLFVILSSHETCAKWGESATITLYCSYSRDNDNPFFLLASCPSYLVIIA